MQGARLYGQHITVCAWKVQNADGTWPTNFTSVVGDIESITIDLQNENRDAKALQDVWEYPITVSRRWRITVNAFLTGTANGTDMKQIFLDAYQYNRALQFQIAYDPPGAAKGDLYAGQGVIETAPVEITSDPIILRVTIVGQGPLTISATS